MPFLNVLSPNQRIPTQMVQEKNCLPHIKVKDPVTHSTWEDGRYTTYKLTVKTEHPAFQLRQSCVRRRFSEIRWLNSQLRTNHRYLRLPRVPSKKLFSERFTREFMDSRAKDMERYLNELIRTDLILGDLALHLFLQTDLTPTEIEAYFNGKQPADFMQKVWARSGNIHGKMPVMLGPSIPRIINMDAEDFVLSRRTQPRSVQEESKIEEPRKMKHSSSLPAYLETLSSSYSTDTNVAHRSGPGNDS